MPSRIEIAKDVLQVAIESGADRVGRITGLITGVVRDVTREVGDWASDVFEVIEAGKRRAENPVETDEKSSRHQK